LKTKNGKGIMGLCQEKGGPKKNVFWEVGKPQTPKKGGGTFFPKLNRKYHLFLPPRKVNPRPTFPLV